MQKITIQRNQPVRKRPPVQKSEARIQQEKLRIFKRNRWIFLACTLVACIIFLVISNEQRKQRDAKELAELQGPIMEHAQMLHDVRYLKLELEWTVDQFVRKYSLYRCYEYMAEEEILDKKSVEELIETFSERRTEIMPDCEKLFRMHEKFEADAKKYNQLPEKIRRTTLRKDFDYEALSRFIGILKKRYQLVLCTAY